MMGRARLKFVIWREMGLYGNRIELPELLAQPNASANAGSPSCGKSGVVGAAWVRWSFGESPMKTHVEFRSNKFPPYEGEEEQINPGLWGERLAEYLVSKLAEKAIKTGKICAEDWGWYIPVDNEDFKLAIGCGHQYGENDLFLCFTHPGAPSFRNFSRR